VSVVCCQVEVSATGWSLVQRGPTECGMSKMCVIVKPRKTRRPRPPRGCRAIGKKTSNPITGLDRPLGFQEVEAHRFIDNRHMKVIRLSALSTGHLYPLGNIPGTNFC
jgi:hypothetical protein